MNNFWVLEIPKSKREFVEVRFGDTILGEKKEKLVVFLENPTVERFSEDLSAISVYDIDMEFFNERYSVAQHNIILSKNLETPEQKLHGLLTGAFNAYISDSMLEKSKLNNISYMDTAIGINHIVYEKLGLQQKDVANTISSIYDMNKRIRETEMRDLFKRSSELCKNPLEEKIVPKSKNEVVKDFQKEYNKIISTLKV
jgi:hypothetical protein